VGQHDLSYRLFFAHRRMIQDLLREIVGERWVERIDFDSGERVDASFVSPKHENRESDVIWKFRRKDGGEPVFVYILLEFQSRPDPSMPVRLMGYESLFYQSLMASHSRRRAGESCRWSSPSSSTMDGSRGTSRRTSVP